MDREPKIGDKVLCEDKEPASIDRIVKNHGLALVLTKNSWLPVDSLEWNNRLKAWEAEKDQKHAFFGKYYGLAHKMSPSDSRQEEWANQRLERGFDSTELWNLDSVICSFIADRLEVFNAKKKDEDFEELVKFFRKMENPPTDFSDGEYYEGMLLFIKNFRRLWT